MSVVYKDDWTELHAGHVIDVLRSLPAGSVQTCVTSPPYWALRDYQVPPTVWGGKPGCEHAWSAPDTESLWSMFGITTESQFCVTCNAWIGSLGLEPTPELYVAHLVDVFREVRRVLRDDGTLWLNLGDCYVKGKPRDVEDHTPGTLDWNQRPSYRRDRRAREDNPKQAVPGLKPKDLVGIPWMVAFALRADGWYLRQDNIWHKRNPMPSSAHDRTTSSHEYLFHLTKREHYFYDRVATFEPRSLKTHARGMNATTKALPRQERVKGHIDWQRAHADVLEVRNKRSVWSISTQAFKGAHFATFPEKLVEPCIKAGTSDHGACSFCGAPWRRLIRRKFSGNWNPDPGSNHGTKINRQAADRKGAKWNGVAWKEDVASGYKDRYHGVAPRPDPAAGNLLANTDAGRKLSGEHDAPFGYVQTYGWRRTCKCELFGDLTPCVVLDPFVGAATVPVVAKKLGRRSIGIDLKAGYIQELAIPRLHSTPAREDRAHV